MRDPHVRFCERRGGVIPRAYSTGASKTPGLRLASGQNIMGMAVPSQRRTQTSHKEELMDTAAGAASTGSNTGAEPDTGDWLASNSAGAR